MGINASLLSTIVARDGMRSGSLRLESREMKRRCNKRHTRNSTQAMNQLNFENVDIDEKDVQSKNMLKTDWFSLRRSFVCPGMTLEFVEEGTDECPILMEKFQECKLDFNEELKYETKNSDGDIRIFNKVTIDGCKHSFFPLALAMHWMIHGMRCPLCKFGDDKKLSISCLPLFYCAHRIKNQVKKIKNEMDEEVFESDIQLVQSIRFDDDMQLLDNVSGEHFPTAIMLDVIPLQNWEIINNFMGHGTRLFIFMRRYFDNRRPYIWIYERSSFPVPLDVEDQSDDQTLLHQLQFGLSRSNDHA